MDIGEYRRETSFINFSPPASTSPGWEDTTLLRNPSGKKSYPLHFISSPLSILPPDAEAPNSSTPHLSIFLRICKKG